MDIATLKLFVDVAQRGSFSSIARERGMDPSSISRALALLEGELGTRLLQRTTRRMVLTEAGETYLSHVKPLLEELDRARESVSARKDEPEGSLRLTASIAFGQRVIVPLIPEFRARFPRLQLELLFSDANLDLIADRIDLAIRLASTYRADVVGAKLMPTRFRVVASPAYLARHGQPETPAALADHSCLFFTLPEFRGRWLFRREGVIEEVPVRGDLSSSTALALRELSLAGLGPALLADWLINADLKGGALVDLFPQHDVAATSFDTAAWLLYPSRRFLPAKVRMTIDFLRRHLAGRAISA